MKEEFYQKQMLEMEKTKMKALLDIRDSLQAIVSIGINFLAADEGVSDHNYQKCVDVISEANKAFEERWGK